MCGWLSLISMRVSRWALLASLTCHTMQSSDGIVIYEEHADADLHCAWIPRVFVDALVHFTHRTLPEKPVSIAIMHQDTPGSSEGFCSLLEDDQSVRGS